MTVDNADSFLEFDEDTRNWILATISITNGHYRDYIIGR